jgi:hypothetical protein
LGWLDSSKKKASLSWYRQPQFPLDDPPWFLGGFRSCGTLGHFPTCLTLSHNFHIEHCS